MINIYTPIGRSSKYIKHKLAELEGDIGSSTITVGNFNTPTFHNDRKSRQKMNKKIEDFSNTISQTDLRTRYL